MTAICGLGNLASEILMAPAATNPPGLQLALSGEEFGPFESAVKQCITVLYNYNNVTLGLFTIDSWFGKYPGLVTHWKIAAGVEPTVDEFAIWAAALIHSGRNAEDGDSNPWLLSWLQVLTYQMSGFNSAIAETAVSE